MGQRGWGEVGKAHLQEVLGHSLPITACNGLHLHPHSRILNPTGLPQGEVVGANLYHPPKQGSRLTPLHPMGPAVLDQLPTAY